MKPTPSIFEVRRLRVAREVTILHDVSWRVDRGQHWVILGANGSGKTSLLSALTGYLAPTSGEITIGDARFGATDWRDVRTAVGLVSASLGHRIEPEQTGREVILSGRHAQINLWNRVTAAEEREAPNASCVRSTPATSPRGPGSFFLRANGSAFSSAAR